MLRASNFDFSSYKQKAVLTSPDMRGLEPTDFEAPRGSLEHDVLTTLANPERYLRGVLKNLYECKSQKQTGKKGDVVARIGITGEGTFPHYRIDYFDDVDLSGRALKT